MAYELFPAEAFLARLQKAYLQTLELLKQQGAILSLERLLDIDACFDDFEPHPQRKTVEEEVKQFCVDHHIWHERTGDVYNTMTAYLHPFTAEPALLATIGKVYALLYFMDDYIGNEKQKHLTADERAQASGLLERLVIYLSMPTHGYRTDPNVLQNTPIEIVSRALIEEIESEVRSQLHPDRLVWFKKFAGYLLQHLNKAIVEQDEGGLMSIDEYIAVRDEVSGMKPAVLLMEFGSRNYLPRRRLAELDLLEPIEELELLCIRYGGLVNDFFSFYKEVMEDCTIFNLVSIEFLNADGDDLPFTFLNTLRLAADRIIAMKERFFSLRDAVSTQVQELNRDDPQLAGQVARHVQDVANGVVATWRWQLEDGNPRYARNGQQVIFTEVAQPDPADVRTIQPIDEIVSLLSV